MNYQEITVYVLFALALIYLGYKIYGGIVRKQSAKGCAGCKVAEMKS